MCCINPLPQAPGEILLKMLAVGLAQSAGTLAGVGSLWVLLLPELGG